MEIKVSDDYEKIVPRPSKAEYSALKESIRNLGLQSPIIVNPDGVILDGYTRFRICEELRINPDFVVRTFANEPEEEQFVITSALKRRNLNDFQKVKLGQRLLAVEREIAQTHMKAGTSVAKEAQVGRATKVVAEEIGVSAATFERAQALIERAPESVKQRLESGRVAIGAAYLELMAKERNEARIARYKDVVADSNLGCGNFTKPSSIKWNHSGFGGIKDDSVNLILTDPPYPKEFIPLHDELGKFAARVLKPGGSLVAMENPNTMYEMYEQLAKHLTYRWTIAFQMPSGGEQRALDLIVQRHRWKPVLWFSKGHIQPRTLADDTVTSPEKQKSVFDWQQDDVGFEALAQLFSTKGQTICDPMMGAGTTGVAAARLKRPFIGIELDSDRYTIAEGKIAKAQQKSQ